MESAVYGFTWRSVVDPPPLEPPSPQPGTPGAGDRLRVPVVAQMRRRYRASESAVRGAVLGHSWRRVDALEPPLARAAVGGWTVVSEADERAIVAARRQHPAVSYRQIAAELSHDVAVVHRAHRLTAARGNEGAGSRTSRPAAKR
ncbi:hypothetical protein [Streptomyces sp. NPDC094031]|uniref:hypothetical protein n=1 Tax=Streptomyces sp. NPDC094031 TaxID=3155307 RepID=UPI003330A823